MNQPTSKLSCTLRVVVTCNGKKCGRWANGYTDIPGANETNETRDQNSPPTAGETQHPINGSYNNTKRWGEKLAQLTIVTNAKCERQEQAAHCLRHYHIHNGVGYRHLAPAACSQTVKRWEESRSTGKGDKQYNFTHSSQ
jgi:hypothetical protein